MVFTLAGRHWLRVHAWRINCPPFTPFHHQRLVNGWAEASFKSMPTAWLTLTIKEPRNNDSRPWKVSNASLINRANRLLYFINQDFFSNRSKKRGQYLEGFGCIEPQSNHQPHIHLALTNKFPPKTLLRLEAMFRTKMKKFSNFDERGFDFQQVSFSDEGFRRIGSYAAKGMDMLVLSQDGLLS